MLADRAISSEAFAHARDEEVALVPRSRGFLAAPHLLFALARTLPPGETAVTTTLDLALQRFVEGQVRAVVASLGERRATAAAALVVENRTGDVLAYVGSPDYFSDAALGRNDGVQALRQPGSTLKPFVYELALERNADPLDDDPRRRPARRMRSPARASTSRATTAGASAAPCACAARSRTR